MEPRKCPVCGAEFTPKVFNQKYCRPECSSDAKGQRDRWTQREDRAKRRKMVDISNRPWSFWVGQKVSVRSKSTYGTDNEKKYDGHILAVYPNYLLIDVGGKYRVTESYGDWLCGLAKITATNR